MSSASILSTIARGVAAGAMKPYQPPATTLDRPCSRKVGACTDIWFGPAGVITDDSVKVHMICADPLWVALRPDDPLAACEAVSWKQLRDRPLINYMPNIAVNVLSSVPPRHQPKEMLPVHRVNTALSMLKVRQGAVICPSMAAELTRGFGLTFLPLTQPAVRWRIAAFTPSPTSLSPAVESFLSFALNFTQSRAATSLHRGSAAGTAAPGRGRR